ncbi:MAG: nitrate- and nitrite sensing domain-containing protein [Sulfurimonas sp.]|nr:nitrate- and nitrite sensing domain-containing protein [Sulfurimonas sp.]
MKIVLIIAILFFNIQAKPLFSNDAQASTSKYMESLRDLIISTQKTRGLTNAYLNGDEYALLTLFGTTNDMKEAIGKMESLKIASDPLIESKATLISRELTSLNREAVKSVDTQEVFNRYTDLIGQSLLLAQTISRHASKKSSDFGKESTTLMMESLLPFAEHIGVLRGIGAGLAAKKTSSRKNRSILISELAKVQVFSQNIQSKVSKIIIKHKDKIQTSVIKEKLKKLDTATENYLVLTQKNILKNTITYDSSEYFNKGTEIITQSMSIYDDINKAVLADSKGWLF